MFIPEEETVNTIIEKGTFYTPDIKEPEEKSPLKKALTWIAGGVAVLLLLLFLLL